MNRLIAYCGLDCEACEARKATLKNDEALREKVAREWSELNGVEITPESINCEGCRMDGAKTPFCEKLCEIRQCALGKGHTTCGDCDGIDTCKTVSMVISHNAEARRRLKGTDSK